MLVEETNSPYDEKNQDQTELLLNQPEIEELVVREIKRMSACQKGHIYPRLH